MDLASGHCLRQQSFHHVEPFCIEWLVANGLASATVPIACVPLIAFLAVEIRMHPRAIPAFVLLRGFVRPCPIALGVPPQSGEGERAPVLGVDIEGFARDLSTRSGLEFLPLDLELAPSTARWFP